MQIYGGTRVIPDRWIHTYIHACMQIGRPNAACVVFALPFDKDPMVDNDQNNG